ncbi:hypothetical protein, conserved [Leishmania tarentolae]|uniref:Uncharacterized protein n=1 Tax=Leishmania tarentolae TaxID=5689 RepID=A0A640KVZ6_LEITA|nr:hypothetical protein, conserved [Leishmania tarentolae]
MPPALKRPTGAGGHRVHHLGNAVVFVVVFVVALMLSMVMNDPQLSRHFLSARRRNPPIDLTESVLVEGFTPVVVRVNKHTVLAVPAAAVHGTRYVSRALDNFFAVGLGSADGTYSRGNNETEAETHSQGTMTMSDVYAALLLRARVANTTKAPDATAKMVETVSSSSHRPSVLHLCSAVSCVTPYIAQQWADRAAAALLLLNKSDNGSSIVGPRARPVANVALVFGEASESLAVMRELGEHRVSTPQMSLAHSYHQPAMLLVGKLSYADLQASCSSLKLCRYRSPFKHTQIGTRLKARAEQLPSEAARKRLLKEWVRRNDAHSATSVWGAVDVLPFDVVGFDKPNTPYGFPPDLVHVEVGSSDSVAALAYLDALASATATPEPPLPRNLIVSLFASEWVNSIVEKLLLLERGMGYSAIPLYDSCVGLERNSTPRERWSVSRVRSWMDQHGLEETYRSASLEWSRAAEIPLCIVVLSREFGTRDELLRMAMERIDSFPPAASPVERFFYYSLGLSPEDEELLTPLPEVATGAKAFPTGSVTDIMRGVIGFLVQHIYFLIPMGVAFALTRNLCRRRGVRG